MRKTFLIKEDSSNSRLDRWFKRNVFNAPQSLIEKNLRKGNIKVNNKKNRSSYKLKINDLILVQNINFTPNLNKKKYNKIYTYKKRIIIFI